MPEKRMIDTDNIPYCQFVAFDAESDSAPFDITVGDSERISFSLEDAKKLRRELSSMIRWYEVANTSQTHEAGE